jgi:hypothetical protein
MKKKRTYTLDEIANFMVEPEQFKKDVANLSVQWKTFYLKYGDLGIKVLLDLLNSEMKDILSKYTERLVTQEAKAIDDFIGERIPKWQTKIMLRFPFLVKLFSWEIVNTPDWGNFGRKIELKRRGKLIGTLKITTKLVTK